MTNQIAQPREGKMRLETEFLLRLLAEGLLHRLEFGIHRCRFGLGANGVGGQKTVVLIIGDLILGQHLEHDLFPSAPDLVFHFLVSGVEEFLARVQHPLDAMGS